MLEALVRLGISDAMMLAIASLYETPTFAVRGTSGHTAVGKVSAGIRQGCPLSPYLCIAVLSVMLHDVDAALLSNGTPRTRGQSSIPPLTWST